MSREETLEPIILASGSPRRQEILKTLGVPFQVIIPEVDESELDGVELEKISEYLASKKVEYVSKILPAKLLNGKPDKEDIEKWVRGLGL